MQLTKKIALAVMAIGMAFSLHAQVAVKAGVNFSNMLFEEEDNSIEDLARNGATKFTAGVAFILPFSDAVALQPELLFTQKGAKSTYTVLGEEFTNDLTYNYLPTPPRALLLVIISHFYGLLLIITTILVIIQKQ